LEVVGDDERRGPRDGQRLAVTVVDTTAQRRRRQFLLHLAHGQRGVVRVIKDLQIEKAHAEEAKRRRQCRSKKKEAPGTR
jgi:hypothetical protein